MQFTGLEALAKIKVFSFVAFFFLLGLIFVQPWSTKLWIKFVFVRIQLATRLPATKTPASEWFWTQHERCPEHWNASLCSLEIDAGVSLEVALPLTFSVSAYLNWMWLLFTSQMFPDLPMMVMAPNPYSTSSLYHWSHLQFLHIITLLHPPTSVLM